MSLDGLGTGPNLLPARGRGQIAFNGDAFKYRELSLAAVC